MIFGEMTTIQFFRTRPRQCREYSKFSCRIFLLTIISWLAGLLGKRLVDQEAQLLPDGCRAIPAGHFNFDGAMVEFFGGKEARDSINKAIIYQRFMSWIETNRLAGRNMRDGQAYSWNTYAQWAADIRIFHPKTIQKHVLTFEALGLLSSQQPNKRDGDCTKHYTSPLRLSDNPEQMLLWSEQKTPMVGAEDSDHSSIQNLSAHYPAIRNAKTPATTARGRKPIGTGAVAVFPNHIPGSEMAERKAEIPEQRPPSDEHESLSAIPVTPATPDVYAPPPVPRAPSPTGDESTEIDTVSSGDVPEWMPDFFTGCTGDELTQLLHRYGEATLLTARNYAENPDNHIENPPGYVRAQLAKGWRPPVGKVEKSYRQSWMGDPYAEMEAATTEYLERIVSDDSDINSLYKAIAREELMARQREGV